VFQIESLLLESNRFMRLSRDLDRITIGICPALCSPDPLPGFIPHPAVAVYGRH